MKSILNRQSEIQGNREQSTLLKRNDVILAENQYYSMDDYRTRCNNNVIVVGAPGCGKTTGIVEPNILQAYGSYIVSDPKGRLYRKYANYLKKKGYNVHVLDMTQPDRSSHYNPFYFLHTTQDAVRMAYAISYQKNMVSREDPFWDQASTLLISSLIDYLKKYCAPKYHTLHNLALLISMCYVSDTTQKSTVDTMMEELGETEPDCFAVNQYKKFRSSPAKTLQSILITADTKMAGLDMPELNKMTGSCDIDFKHMGNKATAVFVVISDTDRSMDSIANLFFTQAFQELCSYADKECTDGRLPVPVRFIMDDFATNICIDEYPRIASCIRSRGISSMIILQSEGQLRGAYANEAETILASADTYVYMGGNDIETAKSVAVRADLPVQDILAQPIGYTRIFRRGSRAVYARNFDLELHKDMFHARENSLVEKLNFLCRS